MTGVARRRGLAAERSSSRRTTSTTNGRGRPVSPSSRSTRSTDGIVRRAAIASGSAGLGRGVHAVQMIRERRSRVIRPMMAATGVRRVFRSARTRRAGSAAGRTGAGRHWSGRRRAGFGRGRRPPDRSRWFRGGFEVARCPRGCSRCRAGGPGRGRAWGRWPASICADTTRRAAASSARCPSRPKPVMSVAAFTHPRLGDLVPRRVQPLHQAGHAADERGDARPRLIAVVAMPVPRGLVRTRRSPGRAAALVIILRGSTMPVTARP